MPDALPMQRVMAFDFGLRRIGVAMGQALLGTAEPVTLLPARDGVPDWEQIARLIKTWQPDGFVVGLPLNMDGTESELCQRARRFAARLHGRFHLPAEMMDERLSSFDARERLWAQGNWRNRQETPLDGVAAVLILESWFAHRAEQARTGLPPSPDPS